MDQPQTHDEPMRGQEPLDPLFDQLQKSGHDGDCPYPCPICAGVGLLKQMSPEIGEHLAAAAKEFMLAARAFLESVAESHPRKETEPIERIPFD